MHGHNLDPKELRRLDAAHHLPAQSDYQLQRQLGGSRVIVSAEGCYVTDADGKRMLDGMAGLWCVAVGYGRKELAEVAAKQMEQLPYYNTFFKTASPPPILLAARLAELLGPPLSHIFFNNSGSEANDTALRLVRHYWELKGQPERQVVISRLNAYHGSTVAGASLGGMPHMHSRHGIPIPGVTHIRQPYWFGEGFGTDPEAFAAECAQALEDRILEVGPEKVAAFIGEPVQGAGGVVIPPPGYWTRIEAICRKYDILLIVDEVITGFGRLGSPFGFQHFGVTPDIVCMAKALSSGYLPIAATAVASHIVDTFVEKGGEFSHGYTYSGHPVTAAVALANLDIIAREKLVERVADDIGPYFAERLQTLSGHPLVGEVRTIGLLGAIEIVAEPGTNRRFGGAPGTGGPAVRDAAIAGGLMVRAVRDTIVLCPPLIISRAEVDEAVAILARSLDQAAEQLRELEAA